MERSDSMTQKFKVQIMLPAGPVPAELTFVFQPEQMGGDIVVYGNRTSFRKVIMQNEQVLVSGEAQVPFGQIRFTAVCQFDRECMRAVVRVPNMNEEIQIHGNRVA